MAKRSGEPASGTDKAKVRVFFAEVEGNNESVQEALKTMVSAMSRPVRVISDQKVNGRPPALIENVDVEQVEDAPDLVDEVDSSEEEPSSQTARKPRGTGKKVDRNAGLELVPNLNFRPVGKQAFKEFVQHKDPKNDVEMVVVALHYMQHLMELPTTGPSHVMTAFKEAGKAIPVDLRQTIRNVKKAKMWVNFTDIEDVKTTTQGDNFVEHEMGKANSS